MIRTYRDEDFDGVLKLLQETLVYDTITPELLKEKLYEDPQFEPEMVLVAEDEGTVAGFMQGVTRDIRGERIGYLKLMGVAQDSRKKGQARKLFEKMEALFRKAGAIKVRIFDVPLNYFQPGIDPRYTEALCFAWRMGFVRFDDTTNLIADLDYSDWETTVKEHKLAKEGIHIRRASEEDRVELLRFIEDEFALWRHEVAMAYRCDPVAVHIAEINDTIRGFSAYNGNNVGTGWFGPMGTSSSLRGKGIGEVLLKRCLRDLKEEGNKMAIIPWVGPIPFYAHHAGARVDRVFWRFEKPLR